MKRPRAVLAALASPIRQELASALGRGPATVTDLAATLGRTRQALYYHMAYLVRAGLVKEAGWRGEGRRREQLYRRAPEPFKAEPRPGNRGDIGLTNQAVSAMLRFTGREFAAALVDRNVRRDGPFREAVAFRLKASLSRGRLRRLNHLLREVYAAFTTPEAAPARGRLYSVTLVLTPSRKTARV